MAVSIRVVHIVVIILPVLCTSIVWRINIDTINLFCIKVFQQLKGMIIVRLNQSMPKVTVRSVLHSVNQFQRWVDWLSKFGHYHNFIHLEDFLLVCLTAVAEHFVTINFHDRINIANVSGL